MEEQYFMEDTIASIRLRVKYRDAYEDWEHQTRKDAFVRPVPHSLPLSLPLLLPLTHALLLQVTARHEQSASTALRRTHLAQTQTHEERRLAALHTKQMEEVAAQLSNFKLLQDQNEKGLKERWDKRSTALWSGIEKVIVAAEAQVRKKLEAEEAKRRAEEAVKAQEIQEMKEKEEKARKVLAEKRLKQEAEVAAARKRQEAEAEVERLKKEQEAKDKVQEGERKRLGLTTALEDWQRARTMLLVCSSVGCLPSA